MFKPHFQTALIAFYPNLDSDKKTFYYKFHMFINKKKILIHNRKIFITKTINQDGVKPKASARNSARIPMKDPTNALSNDDKTE